VPWARKVPRSRALPLGACAPNFADLYLNPISGIHAFEYPSTILVNRESLVPLTTPVRWLNESEKMHHCLRVDEILRLLACALVGSGTKATAAVLACCCKNFEDPVLDVLWGTQNRLFPLLKSLPGEVWKVEAGQFVSPLPAFSSVALCLTALLVKSFNRIPTKAEWSRFRKYAQGMRRLEVDTSQDLVTPDVLLALQLRTGNEPLLPRLKAFVCEQMTEGFTPSIPLFLSPKTVEIRIKFVATPLQY